MGDSIQKIQQTDLATSPIFERLMKVVYHVNQLRAYPMSPIEIAEWSRTLLFGFPNLDIGALEFLIEEMKFGRFEWDKTIGIQNLTLGLPRVEKTQEGYRIKSNATPW